MKEGDEPVCRTTGEMQDSCNVLLHSLKLLLLFSHGSREQYRSSVWQTQRDKFLF